LGLNHIQLLSPLILGKAPAPAGAKGVNASLQSSCFTKKGDRG